MGTVFSHLFLCCRKIFPFASEFIIDKSPWRPLGVGRGNLSLRIGSWGIVGQARPGEIASHCRRLRWNSTVELIIHSKEGEGDICHWETGDRTEVALPFFQKSSNDWCGVTFSSRWGTFLRGIFSSKGLSWAKLRGKEEGFPSPLCWATRGKTVILQLITRCPVTPAYTVKSVDLSCDSFPG